MKLIHITDLHITKAGEKLFGREAIDTLRACIADINKHHSDAELCIITGDLTHNGDTESFSRLKAELDKLTVPHHKILGNHDTRELAHEYFPDMEKDANGYLQKVVMTSRGAFILMDTLEEGTHEGVYGADRQAWLAQQLDAYKHHPVYLFMHHAPFTTGLKAMDTIGVRDEHAKALRLIVNQYDNIKHLFFGHYHRPMSGHWQGIPFSCLRSMMLQVSLDLVNVDFLHGKHEQAQYGVVLLDADQTVVHYHDFADEGDVHDFGD